MTNKETLDLCADLGIGVKSHSSSVEEPQADRVRRKAEREGLVRDQQPEEPKAAPAKKAPAKKAAAKKATAKKAPAKKAAPADEPAVAVVPEPDVQPPTEPAAPDSEPEPARAPAAEHRPLVRSTGREHPPPRPATVDETPPAPTAIPEVDAPRRPALAPSEPAVARAQPPAPAPASPSSPAAPDQAPVSPAGQDDAASPAPPRSSSGKPIPPPPGVGGRGPARQSAPPSGGGGMPAPAVRGRRPPGGGGPRQVVPGAGRAAGAPSGGAPGGGPGGGPPGANRGLPGRGGPQRRKPRKSRRRRRQEELQPIDMPTYTPTDAEVPEGEVVVERGSTPQDVGPSLNRTAADVVRFLMQQGEMVTATQSLNDEMIELFAAEIGAEVRLVDPGEEQEVELQKLLDLEGEDEELAETRPPVITVMGHVDHGKTKLLDYIRKANVVEGEAGGITQHIGAYQVVHDGRPVTFIDTPGHEAFTAMRARGANATDIVVLVVAADDGVMPQTVEAIDHARAAEVPIVVAINKVDRENADPNRVMQQLSEHDLVPESWGGDTVTVEVSALQGTGVDDLIEQLLVVAEVEDLKTNSQGRAQGLVLESHLDVGRGPVATVLVERGTLEVGDPVVAGAASGRVRALIDDHGEQVKSAGPSTPVELLGLSEVASAGDQFVVAPDERTAAKVAETREHYHRQATIGREAHAMSGGAKLEDIFEQIKAGDAATLNLILKADVNGSLEALTEALRKLERDDVKLAFIHRGVGRVTQGDIELAAASNATIIGFNVRPDRKARELADENGVEIRNYEIIYEVIADIESAMVGMLEPEYEEVVTGEAEVREIFSVPRVGKIAGCYVQHGVITRGSKVRFLREGTIIWKGTISSLKRFKEDAREVQSGYECGIGLSDFQDLKQGDTIETFEEKEIPRT
jgi:translation initiation factor IF-2